MLLSNLDVRSAAATASPAELGLSHETGYCTIYGVAKPHPLTSHGTGYKSRFVQRATEPPVTAEPPHQKKMVGNLCDSSMYLAK